MRHTAADRSHNHGAATLQSAFPKPVSPPPASVYSDAICEAIGIDAINPAFENRGHPIPPHRELQNNDVRPEQFALLLRDIRCLCSCLKSFTGRLVVI